MQRLNWFPWSSNEELRHPPGARSGGGRGSVRIWAGPLPVVSPGRCMGHCLETTWASCRDHILSWKALESPGGGGRAFLQELLPQQPG